MKKKVEPIRYALFTPAEIASPETAVDCLYRQFVKLMTLVYNGWNEYEPEYSEQELEEDLRLWRENYTIATVRWKESDVFYKGLRTLIEQVRTWQPEDMPNPAKVGKVTKEQMLIVSFLTERLKEIRPEEGLPSSHRLVWGGSTISFVEIFEGLAGLGYLEIPGGNMTEFVRRLQRAIIVETEDRKGELSDKQIMNRSYGTRDHVLAEKVKALPEAKRRDIQKSQR